jgi:hypothetical protein
LDGYKSLKKKEDLLDCALEMGDGDAILVITLMIRLASGKCTTDNIKRALCFHKKIV